MIRQQHKNAYRQEQMPLFQSEPDYRLPLLQFPDHLCKNLPQQLSCCWNPL